MKFSISTNTTGTVTITYDADGELITRSFFVPADRPGYVREIFADRPGLHPIVCTGLAHRGVSLACTRDRLESVIRREARAIAD
jgi:hypothetical protein